LIKLDLISITRRPDEIVIALRVDGAAANGLHYRFVYRTNPPSELVGKLYDAWPYKPHTEYYMGLPAKNWYASVREGE
jgi:hypothetical protein